MHRLMTRAFDLEGQARFDVKLSRFLSFLELLQVINQPVPVDGVIVLPCHIFL